MPAAELDALLDRHRPGWSLPAALYHSAEAFERDLAAIFRTEWLFACNGAEIADPGAYITMQIGRDSIVVLRDEDGAVRAFHNVCRHRGSRICLSASGTAARLVCPYHQWTYALSGELIHAAHMRADFDPAAFGLVPVHVELVAGLVYVCLAETPPSLARFREAVTSFLAPHEPDRTKVAFQSRIIEKANWKLVIENNRECYHCSANHPELIVTFLEAPRPDDAEACARYERIVGEKAALWESHGLRSGGVMRDSEFRCVRLPFDNGAVSMTLDGSPACAMLLGDLTEPDLGSVRMFRVPNNWNHFLADHIVHCRALPVSPDETELVTTWLVHEDAVEGLDYTVEHLTAVWLATNDEDRSLAENNHLGTLSSAYRPGPYSETEFLTSDFVDWYVAKLRGPQPLRMAAE